MKKFYMVVNPHGGLKKGIKILEKVRPIFEGGGAELTVLETEYAGHAREYANEMDFTGYDGFCAIGGDGTMHEVINGMLKRPDGRKLPIGLVTGGTGNSFMHDLDCLDPEHAAKRILTGRLRPIDIAKVDANGEIIYGFNIVGWGMPTDINFLAEKMRWLGEQRYNVASIIEVMKGKQRLAKLIIDGNIIVGDFGFILGCNTIHTGKGMKMAPLAQLNDGLIDLIIARKASRLKLLMLFPKLFSGGHVGDPLVEYRQVKEFSIIPQEENLLNIDGELIGSTPIHVIVEQGLVNVLV
jgi:YegS/Rv2252/BmrU family lipid kinase